MIAASFASRVRQGGAALARPFDARNIDLTAGVQRTASLVALSQTATNRFAMGSTQSASANYVGNSMVDTRVRYASAGGAHQIGIYEDGATFQNVDTDLGIYNYSSSAAPAAIVNTRVCTDINAQYASGSVTAAIDAGGLIKDCDVSGTSEDGMFPGYDCAKNNIPGTWTVVEGHHGLGNDFNYFEGYPYGGPFPWVTGDAQTNTGLLLTLAQINGASTYSNTTGVAGPAVTNGEFVYVNTQLLGPAMYECIAAGTLGTENPATSWPQNTSGDEFWSNGGASFTSGTATMILVGGGIHSDCFQTTNRQCVVIRRVFGADFSNSCLLLQNAANSNATPPMNWVIEDGVWRGGGNYLFYVQTQTLDSAYTYAMTGLGGTQPSYWSGHNEQGGFVRNSATDWEVNANPGNARPWHVSFRRNTLLTATSSGSSQVGIAVGWTQAMSCYGCLIVRSEAIRDQLIAAQYGWDATDQRIGMMRNAGYDYAALGQPAPVSSVLEARLSTLLSTIGNSQAVAANPGVCDARGMIVWEPNNLNQAGTPVTPSTATTIAYPVNTAVTDSDGYYIGG